MLEEDEVNEGIKLLKKIEKRSQFSSNFSHLQIQMIRRLMTKSYRKVK